MIDFSINFALLSCKTTDSNLRPTFVDLDAQNPSIHIILYQNKSLPDHFCTDEKVEDTDPDGLCVPQFQVRLTTKQNSTQLVTFTPSVTERRQGVTLGESQVHRRVAV